MLEVTHSDRGELEAVMRGAGYTLHKALEHSFPMSEFLPSWLHHLQESHTLTTSIHPTNQELASASAP